MSSKLVWRTAAILGGLVAIGYAGAVLVRTTPFNPAGHAQMLGMEHGTQKPSEQSTEPSAEMEHEAGKGEMVGHDISPVDVSDAPAAGPEARGGQLLQPTMRDDIKEFELTTGIVRWNILPDVEVGAYAYNGQVPGPLIRVQPTIASAYG